MPTVSPVPSYGEVFNVRKLGRAIGLDVHLEFCEIAICEGGKVRSTGSGRVDAGSAVDVGEQS